MPKQKAPHVRNVAGYKLKKISNSVYQQTVDGNLRRWFVRFKSAKSKKYYWRYTPPFADSPAKHSMKIFWTLTAAVLAANSQ